MKNATLILEKAYTYWDLDKGPPQVNLESPTTIPVDVRVFMVYNALKRGLNVETLYWASRADILKPEFSMTAPGIKLQYIDTNEIPLANRTVVFSVKDLYTLEIDREKPFLPQLITYTEKFLLKQEAPTKKKFWIF